MNRPEPVDSSKAYDGYAARYDSLLSENLINAHMRSVMTALEGATFRPGERLLELGCGTGDEAIELASRGCDVVGIDPSEQMIRVAREKAASRRLPGSLRFQVGYARDLATVLSEESNASFAGGFSSFALSYEPDLEMVRTGLVRLIRPGGVFLAATMNRLSGIEWTIAMGSLHPSLAGRRLARATRHKVGDLQTTVYCRSPKELGRAFSPGFTLERLRALPVALPPHYANRPLQRWPMLLRALSRIDARVGGWPILDELGDHTVAWLRRTD